MNISDNFNEDLNEKVQNKIKELQTVITSKVSIFIEEFRTKYHSKQVTDIILPIQKQEQLVELFYAEFDKAIEVKIDQSRRYNMVEARSNPYQNYLAEANLQENNLDRPKSSKRVKSADSRLKNNKSRENLSRVLPSSSNNQIYFLKDDNYYRQDCGSDEWLKDKHASFGKISQNSVVTRLRDGSLFCSGGLKVKFDNTKNTQEGSLISQCFKLTADGKTRNLMSMEAGRAFHQQVLTTRTNKLQVVGGYMQPREVQSYFVTNLLDVQDLGTNSWTGLKSMRNERVDFGCCYSEIAHCLIVAGGRDNDLNVLNSVEVQHIPSDNWFLLLEPLAVDQYKFAMTFMSETELLICGGLKEDNTKAAKVIKVNMGFDQVRDSSKYFELKNIFNLYQVEELPEMGEPDQVESPNGSLILSQQKIQFIGRQSTQIFSLDNFAWQEGRKIIGNQQDMNGQNMFVQ